MIEQSVSLASNGVVKVPGYEQLVRFGYTKNRGVYRLAVTASGEWDGLTIRAFWHTSDGKDPPSSLVVDGYVDVPASVTAQSGNGCITFEGSDGTKTVTSADLRYRVAANSGTEDGTEPEPGTPAWQQLVDAVHTDAATAEQAKTDAQTAAQQSEASAKKAGKALSDTITAKEDALKAIGDKQTTATQAVDTARDKALQQVEASTEATQTAANEAATSAGSASQSAQKAAGSLQELKDGIANGDFKGEPGNDGKSPVVAVTDIENGHRVSITDKDGTKTIDVLNGQTGKTGATPVLTIGTVSSGDKPSADITGTPENPVLNLRLQPGPQGPAVALDTTLTHEGEAADAKATGDAIQGVSGNLVTETPRAKEAENQLKQDLGDITQSCKSSNILEITDYTEGRYYSASSGDYRYNNNFFTVDNYVEVEPSSSYVLSEFIDGVFEKLLSFIIIFYDKNKKYLSGGQYSTFTTPENANYIRISPNKDALKKQLLLEKGTEPSKIWVPYYEALYVKGEKVINFSYSDIKDKPTINGVEISGNKTSKDYGIPDVAEITETYNLYKTNEITVDINGSGDFEKLQNAIKSITDNSENNRFIIYIKEGEYDLAEGIADDENDSSVVGLMIPNWVTLKGLGNRENVILKAKFINKNQYVSTLNFKETGAIENLTVIGENTRYVIHDDSARKSNGYKRIVKHCIIKGITTYYSTVYGAGTGDGADWEFEDVVFDGSQVGANSRPANTFTVHNVLASQKNRNIVFKNCIFVSTNEKNVKLKTLAYRTSTGADNANNMLTNVSLYGCKFDGTSKGFELVEENPDVYGKGCYYYVNGYGNVNAGYEITTTDNKDYSNRVNLI